MSAVPTIRLGVLTMDQLPDEVRSIGGDYATLYADLVRHGPVEIVEYAAHRGVLPDAVDECDAWLIGGSRRSVNDDEGWIRDGEDFVRRAMAAERPLVGICFGHQLVASALGGTVEDVGWGLGAQDYAVTTPVPGLDDERVTLIASHRDQITALPPDAAVWIASDRCPVAGMVVGDHVWTIQAHPEFTAAVAGALFSARTEVMGRAAVDAACSTLDRPLSNDAVGRAIVGFIDRRR